MNIIEICSRWEQERVYVIIQTMGLQPAARQIVLGGSRPYL